MDTWHLYQGTKMQSMKKLTYNVHLNSKNVIDVAEGFRV